MAVVVAQTDAGGGLVQTLGLKDETQGIEVGIPGEVIHLAEGE